MPSASLAAPFLDSPLHLLGSGAVLCIVAQAGFHHAGPLSWLEMRILMSPSEDNGAARGNIWRLHATALKTQPCSSFFLLRALLSPELCIPCCGFTFQPWLSAPLEWIGG